MEGKKAEAEAEAEAYLLYSYYTASLTRTNWTKIFKHFILSP